MFIKTPRLHRLHLRSLIEAVEGLELQLAVSRVVLWQLEEN